MVIDFEWCVLMLTLGVFVGAALGAALGWQPGKGRK